MSKVDFDGHGVKKVWMSDSSRSLSLAGNRFGNGDDRERCEIIDFEKGVNKTISHFKKGPAVCRFRRDMFALTP